MNEFHNLMNDIISNPLPSLLTVLSLILIESLLSVDNAAVLATMVKVLEPSQQKKALRYGIWGAYLMRGLSMLIVSFIINADQFIGDGNSWHTIIVYITQFVKALGGLYLLKLTYKKFFTSEMEDINEPKGWYAKLTKKIGLFWSTVILVEVMDMVFSVDNIFAAVAYTKNIILVILGVFIGILAMRFIAQAFVNLMDKYPYLEDAAYIVIGILGIKLLSAALITFFAPHSFAAEFIESKTASVATSIVTVLVFFLPILFIKKKTTI